MSLFCQLAALWSVGHLPLIQFNFLWKKSAQAQLSTTCREGQVSLASIEHNGCNSSHGLNWDHLICHLAHYPLCGHIPPSMPSNQKECQNDNKLMLLKNSINWRKVWSRETTVNDNLFFSRFTISDVLLLVSSICYWKVFYCLLLIFFFFYRLQFFKFACWKRKG